MMTGDKTILLVEDNPGDVHLVTEALADSKTVGKIDVAEDGESAIQCLLGIEARCSPDLIFLDLNLPKKDGRGVLTVIKQDPKLRHIPVVVLTSSNLDRDVRQAYDLSANCYLTKPMDVDEFFEKVQSSADYWLGTVRLAVN